MHVPEAGNFDEIMVDDAAAALRRGRCGSLQSSRPGSRGYRSPQACLYNHLSLLLMRSDDDGSIITILNQIKTLVLDVKNTLDPLELSVQAPGIRSSETRLKSSPSPAPPLSWELTPLDTPPS